MSRSTSDWNYIIKWISRCTSIIKKQIQNLLQQRQGLKEHKWARVSNVFSPLSKATKARGNSLLYRQFGVFCPAGDVIAWHWPMTQSGTRCCLASSRLLRGSITSCVYASLERTIFLFCLLLLCWFCSRWAESYVRTLAFAQSSLIAFWYEVQNYWISWSRYHLSEVYSDNPRKKIW